VRLPRARAAQLAGVQLTAQPSRSIDGSAVAIQLTSPFN
jgi:hypothetical protein